MAVLFPSLDLQRSPFSFHFASFGMEKEGVGETRSFYSFNKILRKFQPDFLFCLFL